MYRDGGNLSIINSGPVDVWMQKQPSSDVLIKTCSDNMQQFYRRAPMSKCDFTKIAKQLY